MVSDAKCQQESRVVGISFDSAIAAGKLQSYPYEGEVH